MKKLSCKTALELESALNAAEEILRNEMRHFSGFEFRLINTGSFATIDIVYTECCELTGLETKRIIKAINQVSKIYKGVFFTVCAEKYMVERLNAFLYRPVFHVAIPLEKK